jgi:hypothetical protein
MLFRPLPGIVGEGEVTAVGHAAVGPVVRDGWS